MWLDGTYLGYINTKMFRKLALPNLATIVKKATFPINLFLSGGPCKRYLQDIKNAGITCIEGLDPPPKGDIVLSEAKDMVGDKVCLKGNVDTVLLEAESPESIEKAVKDCVDSAAYGGGYFLSAVDQPTIKTPLENMTSFVKAGKKFGIYNET
jgi:uroporphyrinogen decarboxylase